MILVSGAAGKTGRAVVRALSRRGEAVRAWVRRAEQVPVLLACGAGECAVGDMQSVSDWTLASAGIRSIYLICPNMSRDELGIGRLALSTARHAGVEHFVYHSVLHPQAEKMPHHWNKLRVEEALLEAGLAFTILQPASYMQNVLGAWPAIVSEGKYQIPYAINTRLAMVDLDDVATVAAKVLSEPGHRGASYELANGELLTQLEVAETIAVGLGRPVRAETIEIEAWRERARRSGIGPDQMEMLVAMFGYYEQYGFRAGGYVLRSLLGREPTSFGEFTARHAAENA